MTVQLTNSGRMKVEGDRNTLIVRGTSPAREGVEIDDAAAVITSDLLLLYVCFVLNVVMYCCIEKEHVKRID